MKDDVDKFVALTLEDDEDPPGADDVQVVVDSTSIPGNGGDGGTVKKVSTEAVVSGDTIVDVEEVGGELLGVIENYAIDHMLSV